MYCCDAYPSHYESSCGNMCNMVLGVVSFYLKIIELCLCMAIIIVHRFSDRELSLAEEFLICGACIGFIIICFGQIVGHLDGSPVYRGLDLVYSLVGFGLMVPIAYRAFLNYTNNEEGSGDGSDDGSGEGSGDGDEDATMELIIGILALIAAFVFFLDAVLRIFWDDD